MEKLTPILNKILLILLLATMTANSQIYSSRKAKLSEKVGIMYFKGHFNFLYTPKNNTRLVLKKDSTFIYSQNFCQVSEKVTYGIWKIKKDDLILTIKDSSKVNPKTLDIMYKKYNDSVFYKISTSIRVKDNEKIKSLTLLSLDVN